MAIAELKYADGDRGDFEHDDGGIVVQVLITDSNLAHLVGERSQLALKWRLL